MLSVEVSEGRGGWRGQCGQCCETKSEPVVAYVRVDSDDELKSFSYSRGHRKDAKVCLAGGYKLRRF